MQQRQSSCCPVRTSGEMWAMSSEKQSDAESPKFAMKWLAAGCLRCSMCCHFAVRKCSLSACSLMGACRMSRAPCCTRGRQDLEVGGLVEKGFCRLTAGVVHRQAPLKMHHVILHKQQPPEQRESAGVACGPYTILQLTRVTERRTSTSCLNTMSSWPSAIAAATDTEHLSPGRRAGVADTDQRYGLAKQPRTH